MNTDFIVLVSGADYYITHKNSTHLKSSYSYECKKCTIERIRNSRRKKNESKPDLYPDW